MVKMNYETWKPDTRYLAGVTVKAVLDGITSYHKCRIPHISADPYDVTNTTYWMPVAEPEPERKYAKKLRIGDARFSEIELKAIVIWSDHKDWSITQIAEAIGVHPRTLSHRRAPNFNRVKESR